MWLLWGLFSISDGLASLCDQGSFFVPRSPYRLCLRSSPPPLSLSAWKPCSATSGSCSILPGPGPWSSLAGMLVQTLSGACLRTGLERYQQSTLSPQLHGCCLHSVSMPLALGKPSWSLPGFQRALMNARPPLCHPLPPPCDGANVS